MSGESSPSCDRLVERLSQLKSLGPIRSVNERSSAASDTLFVALGENRQAGKKSTIDGYRITVHRLKGTAHSYRTNLFAAVPDWGNSFVSSSAEFMEVVNRANNQHGSLYCTVDAARPNSRGLILRVDAANDSLTEYMVKLDVESSLVNWGFKRLTNRLHSTCPDTLSVFSSKHLINGIPHFRYERVIVNKGVRLDRFLTLIRKGVITIDHLIEHRNGRVCEKGPLFKISPDNYGLLYSNSYLIEI